MTITPAMAECLEKLDRAAAQVRRSFFFRYFMCGVDRQVSPRLLTRYSMYDACPAERIKIIRGLLKYDRERRRQGLDFLPPATMATFCGLLVAEGRAIRETGKVAKRFAHQQLAAE